MTIDTVDIGEIKPQLGRTMYWSWFVVFILNVIGDDVIFVTEIASEMFSNEREGSIWNESRCLLTETRFIFDRRDE